MTTFVDLVRGPPPKPNQNFRIFTHTLRMTILPTPCPTAPRQTQSKSTNHHRNDTSHDTLPDSPPQNESKSANLHLYTHQTTLLTTPCPMSKCDFGKEGVTLSPRWEATDLALALPNMPMKRNWMPPCSTSFVPPCRRPPKGFVRCNRVTITALEAGTFRPQSYLPCDGSAETTIFSAAAVRLSHKIVR